MKSFKFIVKGRVQGVYYRKFTSDAAAKENFSGYVKNLPDGNVEACVTCDDNELDNFVKILKNGSPHSIVNSLQKFECEEIFSGTFEIRY